MREGCVLRAGEHCWLGSFLLSLCLCCEMKELSTAGALCFSKWYRTHRGPGPVVEDWAQPLTQHPANLGCGCLVCLPFQPEGSVTDECHLATCRPSSPGPVSAEALGHPHLGSLVVMGLVSGWYRTPSLNGKSVPWGSSRAEHSEVRLSPEAHSHQV